MSRLIEGIQAWGAQIEARYRATRPGSMALADRARAALPGGDSRFGVSLTPFSTTFVQGRGQRLWDIDGNEYLDQVNNNTALIHGHSHPAIIDAVERQIHEGTAWAAPNPAMIELAEMLVERIPSFELVRFTNSGTEANALMVKLARAFTGRDLIIKMGASYHGSADLFEFGPGPNDPSRPHPLMEGLPTNLAENVAIGRFNDIEGCLELITRHRDRLAGVILTPVLSPSLDEPAGGFLDALREATAASGALLLFDEVISLRLGRGGAQERYGVTPDLTAVGKIIGGGFPVGAFGGRADIMRLTDPFQSIGEGANAGPRVSHSGTYNGNPVTMTAGRESIRLLTPEAFRRLDEAGGLMAKFLGAAVRETGAPFLLRRVGSMVWLDVDPPGSDPEWATVAPMIRNLIRTAYLTHGVHALGIFNTTTVVTDEQIAEAAHRIGAALAELMSFVPVGAPAA